MKTEYQNLKKIINNGDEYCDFMTGVDYKSKTPTVVSCKNLANYLVNTSTLLATGKRFNQQVFICEDCKKLVIDKIESS